MKLFTAAQIREWDTYPINNEPITSIDLMERAAAACADWLTKNYFDHTIFDIYCGMGNNGGDGLAIARLLAVQGKEVKIWVLKTTEKGSQDFETNLKRLQDNNIPVAEIKNSTDFVSPTGGSIIIDALFGTGLSRPLEGLAAEVVSHINNSKNTKICIDVPSGLPADWIDNTTDYKHIICGNFTLTFQIPKLSFLFPETGMYVGRLVVLDIGLSKQYEENTPSQYNWVDKKLASEILKSRNRFSHKGTYGHALIIGGSYGKAGAVMLAAKACVRAGAGLVTAFVPRSACIPMQSYVPEVMVEAEQKEDFLDFLPNETKKYTAIGIGPGMGTQISTRDAIDDFMAAVEGEKLVIDADALNCLSLNFADRKKMKLPAGAILTPHPKEFDRMFGESKTSSERLQKQIEAAKKHNVYIVLKGTHTSVATPIGEVFFNSTGNPGMATGGSGDVLTGIITGLRAQGYNQHDACILGIYLHGFAGDMALNKQSEQSLLAGDLIDGLGWGYKAISG